MRLNGVKMSARDFLSKNVWKKSWIYGSIMIKQSWAKHKTLTIDIAEKNH